MVLVIYICLNFK